MNKKKLGRRSPRTRLPHKQLKEIRDKLGLTQAQAAALLAVDYQYLLSVETGQRELSNSLAAKIAATFGVARIQHKHETPFMRGSKGTLLPFTKEAYLRYASNRPSFYIPDARLLVTPTPEDYARSAHALLEAAEKQHVLGPVLTDFFRWFEKSIVNDAMFESLKERFDELFPHQRKTSEAFVALTVNWGARVDDEVRKMLERREKAAARAAKKRKRQRKR